jgi:hypothetical protein
MTELSQKLALQVVCACFQHHLLALLLFTVKAENPNVKKVTFK